MFCPSLALKLFELSVWCEKCVAIIDFTWQKQGSLFFVLVMILWYFNCVGVGVGGGGRVINWFYSCPFIPWAKQERGMQSVLKVVSFFISIPFRCMEPNSLSNGHSISSQEYYTLQYNKKTRVGWDVELQYDVLILTFLREPLLNRVISILLTSKPRVPYSSESA